jgi:hypothetical protein
MAFIWQRQRVETGNVYAQGRKDSDAGDGEPEKVT